MKIILIFAIMLLPSVAFAADWVDEFPVYIYGDVASIANAFNAIAMIAQSSEIQALTKMGALWVMFLIAKSIYQGYNHIKGEAIKD